MPRKGAIKQNFYKSFKLFREIRLSFEWSHFRISSTDSKVRPNCYRINKQHDRKALLNILQVNKNNTSKNILQNQTQ